MTISIATVTMSDYIRMTIPRVRANFHNRQSRILQFLIMINLHNCVDIDNLVAMCLANALYVKMKASIYQIIFTMKLLQKYSIPIQRDKYLLPIHLMTVDLVTSMDLPVSHNLGKKKNWQGRRRIEYS
jgi:hypothetical protein